MTRYKNIGPWLLQLLLLAIPTHPTTAPMQATDARPALRFTHKLALDQRLSWQEDETPGPRCFAVQVPAKGLCWIEVRSTRPATTPSLLVLATDTNDHPKVLERTDGTLFQFCHPGKHLVCLTSAAPLGDVELAGAFLKGGDPLETEVDPNPLIAPPCGIAEKGGDPLETEVDPNP